MASRSNEILVFPDQTDVIIDGSDQYNDEDMGDYFDSNNNSENEFDLENSDDDIGFSDHAKLWELLRPTESSSMIVDDFNALLIGIQCYHKLPDTAMDAICNLFSSCLPCGNCVPKRYAVMVRNYRQSNGQSDPEINYYCSSKNCNEKLKKLFDSCSNMDCALYGQRQHASGFCKVNIRQQIENIVRTHYLDICQFLASQCHYNDQVGDIPSSPAYIALGPNPNEGVLNISLILSADGSQAFKLGRSSFWPCVAIVAELPPTVRAAVENAVGLAFWIGCGDKCKPDWSVMLPPVINELQMLKSRFEMDICGQSIQVCVRLFATIFDLPAQASIWGHKQFNGNFGCIACRHPRERIGRQILWPELDDEPPVKDEQFFNEAWHHLRQGENAADFFGIMKISPLAKICNPGSVNVLDNMHLVYHGNAQLICNRFFTSQAQKWTALFGHALLLALDNDIKQIRFPHFFSRTVPSLQGMGSFKASEIKHLLVYVILPIMAPYMQNIPNYWHWLAIYVEAIRQLSKPVVYDRDIDHAKLLIDIWQKLIPVLCHESCQTFNAHAAEHLPNQVKKFGPLWAISTFPFESFYGHFSRHIKALKGALLQLSRRFILQQSCYKYLSNQVRVEGNNAYVIRSLFPTLTCWWMAHSNETRYRLIDEIKLPVDNTKRNYLQQKFPNFGDVDFTFSKRAASGSLVLHSALHSTKTANIIRYTRSFFGLLSQLVIWIL